MGTAGIKLPAMDFPNGFTGATAAFAPYTQFDSSGNSTGGYGMVSVIDNRSHSSYHALQISAARELTASGFGFQASYTFSKSIDDTSAVIMRCLSGQSGAVGATRARRSVQCAHGQRAVEFRCEAGVWRSACFRICTRTARRSEESSARH